MNKRKLGICSGYIKKDHTKKSMAAVILGIFGIASVFEIYLLNILNEFLTI
jgi:hypothetical protein